jgi:hypothetical protein
MAVVQRGSLTPQTPSSSTLCTVKMRNAHKMLVEKPEMKRPLERPRHTWENIIKMDLK